MLWAAGILAALLVWLCLTRVGAQAALLDGAIRVDVQVGLFHFRVFPGKKKVKRESGEEETEKKEKKPGKKGPKITFPDVKEAAVALWPPLRRALRRTRRGIRVKPLILSVTLGGGGNPAGAAQLYGQIQAAVWNGMPVLEKLLDIPEPSIHVGVDFDAPETAVDGSVGLTVRIGTILAVVFGVGIPALKWFLRFRKRQKQAQRPQKAAA